MLKGSDVDEIKELKREGLSIRAVSRLTGYGRKTISRYSLAPTGWQVYSPRPSAARNLEPFKSYLKERLQAASGTHRYCFESFVSVITETATAARSPGIRGP